MTYNPYVDTSDPAVFDQGSPDEVIVFSDECRIARKDHVCFRCKKAILKGAAYHYFAGLQEGSFVEVKECEGCRYGWGMADQPF